MWRKLITLFKLQHHCLQDSQWPHEFLCMNYNITLKVVIAYSFIHHICTPSLKANCKLDVHNDFCPLIKMNQSNTFPKMLLKAIALKLSDLNTTWHFILSLGIMVPISMLFGHIPCTLIILKIWYKITMIYDETKPEQQYEFYETASMIGNTVANTDVTWKKQYPELYGPSIKQTN